MSTGIISSGDIGKCPYIIFYIIFPIFLWLAYLSAKADNRETEDIRRNTMTGRACGDEVFVGRMERLLGRRIKAAPRGRPRKKKK